MKNASGLFNLTRNLGGAIGLAAINTLFNDRLMAARFGNTSDAQQMALKQMMGLIRRQAQVMSFADIFLMLTVLFIALALLGLVVKRPQTAPAAGGGGH